MENRERATGGTIRLPRIRVESDRVIGSLVGLRPYRAGGFVVRPEAMDGKLVVHNYGHGGCGLGFFWGSSRLASEEALKADGRECAVLGCGAVGLSAGVLLQRRGFRVTIYARDLPPDTTSNIAGGLWAPFFVGEEEALTASFRAQFRAAATHSHRHFRALVGSEYGVGWIESFFVEDAKSPEPWFFRELPELFPAAGAYGPGEHPFPRRLARRSRTLLIQTPRYLRALERDFRMAGGLIVVREFRERREVLELKQPVIVNCTGLGARELFGDEELVPARGQMTVLLPQPEVAYFAGIDDEALYMIPRDDGILLGGSFEPGARDLEPDPVTSERIFQGHRAFFGAMGKE